MDADPAGGEFVARGGGGVVAGVEFEDVAARSQVVEHGFEAVSLLGVAQAEVAEEAIRAGAAIVNDVSGLKYDRNMASVVARYGVSLIIMHMKGTPVDMQLSPCYKDVVKDIIRDLKISLKMAQGAGIADQKIIIDPGIGFGKTFEHNLEILSRLEEFRELKRPICIGASRKSFIGKALGIKDPGGRLIGTLAASVIAIMKGASLIRVHDVKEAVQAARMADSILRSGAN